MSTWTWLLALYVLGLTGASFYSVYLMEKARGLYDGDISISGEKGTQSGLLSAIRNVVDYYKYLSYALIIGNAIVIISLMLLDFKITWRTDPIISVPTLPAIGGRRR